MVASEIMITFILGGARSGKSKLAEKLATEFELSGKSVFYIATATAFDDEMTDRIAHHQNSRPTHWQTIETPIYLADTIYDLSQKDCVILVDCLTLWISNLLFMDNDEIFLSQTEVFLTTLQNLPSNCELILVSNETGLGVVPMGQLTRKFVDESGFLHQKIAQIADKVRFCVAGLTMDLKG